MFKNYGKTINYNRDVYLIQLNIWEEGVWGGIVYNNTEVIEG